MLQLLCRMTPTLLCAGMAGLSQTSTETAKIIGLHASLMDPTPSASHTQANFGTRRVQKTQGHGYFSKRRRVMLVYALSFVPYRRDLVVFSTAPGSPEQSIIANQFQTRALTQPQQQQQQKHHQQQAIVNILHTLP